MLSAERSGSGASKFGDSNTTSDATCFLEANSVSETAQPVVLEVLRRRSWWKTVVSLLLLYHVIALIVAPATIAPSPQFFRDVYPLFGSYLQFMNMNQGNHFFAPEPGASTLVGYVVETKDGRQVSGRMPHRGIWPRLLYHRHFMLTEALANADDLDPRVSQLLTRALARQILREHGGRSVSLTRVTHFLARMDQVRAGMPLNSSNFFQEQPMGRFEWVDLTDSPPR